MKKYHHAHLFSKERENEKKRKKKDGIMIHNLFRSIRFVSYEFAFISAQKAETEKKIE